MNSWLSIYFKVNRLDRNGNKSDRYSRIIRIDLKSTEIALEGPGLLRVSNLDWGVSDCNRLLSDVRKMFPELDDGNKFRLVSPDLDGDFILLETVQDLHSLISSSKEKYEKGLSIPISVVEWPLNKSSTEATASVAPADSLQTADAMIREMDAEIIRLSERIKALELQLHDRSPEETIDKFRPLEKRQEDDSALLSALTEKMETRFKDQNAEMERRWKNHQETFTKQLAASEQQKDNKLAVLKSILDRMVMILEEQDAKIKRHSDFIRELSESKTKEQEEISINAEELVRTCSQDGDALLPSAPMMMIQQAIVPDLVDGNVQEDGYILVSEQQSSQDEEDTSNKSTSSDSSVTVLIVEEESESSAAEQPILSKPISIRPRPRVFSLTDDDVIDAALKKMEAMGFNDEGGFLTQLLEEKGGDIDKVFDVLI